MYLDVTSRSKWVGEADYELVALPSRSTEAWGQRLPRMVIGHILFSGNCLLSQARSCLRSRAMWAWRRSFHGTAWRAWKIGFKLVPEIFCCQAPESKRGSFFSELLSRLKLRFNETNLLIKCCSGAWLLYRRVQVVMVLLDKLISRYYLIIC